MKRASIAPATVLALAACSPHAVTTAPAAPVQLPATYGEETPAAGQARPERWWTQFGDAELDRLVDASLGSNFDLLAAWSRFAQAVAGADAAGAPRWPTLDASASAQIQNENSFRRDFIPMGDDGAAAMAFPEPPSTIRSARGSIGASYEVDLWNKLGSAAKAAALDRESAHDSVQTMAMSLAAEVTETWLDLVQVRARRALLEKQLEINETFVELLKVRLGQGLASAVEINQQRQLAIDNGAQLELTISNERMLQNRLALLTGKPPGRLQVGARAELPAVPTPPAVGVPSELLQRRPDVRAARRRVEAADYRVAVAVADRYPSLRLTADLTSSPSSLNDWLLDPIWTLAGSIALPIFDGGRRAAEVERNRAIVSEQVAAYGQALLSAMVEVSNALAQAQQQQKHIARIQEQLEVAQMTLEQAQARYGNGMSDFLTVLTALRSQQQVEMSLLAARRQLLSHRVQLFRALGGTWMAELEQPELLTPTDPNEEPQPAPAAAATPPSAGDKS